MIIQCHAIQGGHAHEASCGHSAVRSVAEQPVVAIAAAML